MSFLPPLPTDTQIADQRGRLMRAWQTWLFALALEIGNNGTTPLRPTNNIYVGKQFFDATLGYPVWVQTVGPPIVWVNAAGTVV